MITIISADGRAEQEQLSAMRARAAASNAEIELAVRAILEDVRENGWEAVRRYSEKFDGREPYELEPEEEGVKKYYYHPYTARRLDETIRENGCTVLYLQQIDEIFVESYAELFTDGLAAAQNGETLLYRVTDSGFAPVEMEVTGR